MPRLFQLSAVRAICAAVCCLCLCRSVAHATTASTTTTFSSITATTTYQNLPSGFLTPATLTQTNIAGTGWDLVAQSSLNTGFFRLQGIDAGGFGSGDNTSIRVNANEIDHFDLRANGSSFTFDFTSLDIRAQATGTFQIEALDSSYNVISGSAVTISISSINTFENTGSFSGNSKFVGIYGIRITPLTVAANWSPYIDNIVVANIRTPSSSPSLSSATYDANTGTLAVTGANMVAGDTIAVNTFTLTGEGGGTYTLTSSNVTASSATTFTVTLNATDKAAVNALLNKNGTSSKGGTTYNLAAAASWDSTATATASATNPVTVSNAAAPTVATPTSASVTATGATLGGDVTASGTATITERGLVYSITSTNNNPQIGGTGVTKVADATATTGVFADAVTGLTAGTGYTFAAYATSSVGTSYTSTATFTTLNNNANLSGLTLSAGTLSPAFASSTTSYTASVTNGTSSLTVTPTTADTNATVKVNGNTVTSGTASGSTTLSVGSNTITTVVTGQDGTTTNTYTVTVTRAAPPTPSITSALTASGTYGSAISTYTIAATNSPTSFNATGLPPGLSVNTGNGQITGTPTDTSGSPYNVTISATNSGVTGTATLVFTVNKAPLTITGVTAANKTYDGTTTATLNLGSPVFSGAVNGDSLTVGISGATGAFADANVGTGKTVTTSGFTVTGTGASNYTLTQPTLTANITAKALTVTGLSASNKVYDGTTAATLTGTAALQTAESAGAGNTSDGKPYSGDTISLGGTASGTFASSGIGNSITVNITGLTLSGPQAGNYSLTQPTLSANITGALSFVGTSTALTVNLNSSAVDIRGLLHVNEAATGKTVTWSQSVAPLHGTLTLTGATAASGGTDIAPGGTITYTPATNSTTADSFTVQVSDGTNSATRTINVTFLGQGSASSQFVSVGDSGVLLTSPDAATWTSRTSGTALRLRGVTASGNLIVAVGQSGTVLTSPDGVAWTSRTSGATETLRGVTASPFRFVAVGGDTASLVRYSDDGTNWSGATVPSVGKLRAVAFGGGQFLAVGAAGAVLTSPDGVTWTQQNANTTDDLQGAVWAGSKFTVLSSTGKVLTSTDGVSWNSTQALPPSWIEGLTWSDTQFVTVGASGKVKNSSDGNTWTWQTSGTTNTLHGVTWTGVFTAQTGDPVTLTTNLRKIIISGVTAVNKIYDATVTAALNVASAVLVGVNSADTVNLSTGSATGTFSDKAVGNGKTVATSGFSISGTNAGDYTLVQPATTANISAKALTVTGVTAGNKTYDATTTATLNTGSAALSGVVTGDIVNLSSASASGAFADKAVGSNKTVTISGFSISGTDAANYSLTQPATTASITAKTLAVMGVTANSKVYDGGTAATLVTGGAALSGVISGDTVNLVTGSATGAFANKAVGTGKTVTISGFSLGGTDAANYALTQPSATANITAKAVTVTGVAASNKVYDGTTTATLNTSGAALSGVVSGDLVNLSAVGASGAFADKTVASGKAVTTSGFALSGTDASNYALAQPSTTANITAKSLTITGVTASNKVYDGTATATLNTSSAVLNGIVSGDAVTLTSGSATGAFADKTVGTGKTVTTSGFSLGGADANNYTLTQPSPTANITSKALTVTGATVSNKIYDGTTTAGLNTSSAALSGVINGDSVSLDTTSAVAVFADKDVNTGKSVGTAGFALNGTDASNYSLTQPTFTADITPKTLSVSGVTASDKGYDATTTATLSGTAALHATETAGTGTTSDGKPYAGDDVSLSGTMSGAFADKNAGTGKTITVSGLTLGGAQAADYVLGGLAVTANITAKPLTVSGLSAGDKVYDGTTTAPLTGTAALQATEAPGTGSTTDGLPYTGDAVTVGGTLSGTFAGKDVASGVGVTVTGLSLSGAQANNYSATPPSSLTAAITAKALTVSGLSVGNRVYDGTTTASLTGAAALQSTEAPGAGSTTDGAPYTGDAVTVTGTPGGTFAGKDVGTGIGVTVSGLTLSGTQAADYTLTPPAGLTADITPKSLTFTGLNAVNKIYDATTVAALSGTGALSMAEAPGTGTSSDGKPYTGDIVSATGTGIGVFATKNVGTGIAVSVTGLALTGTQAADYTGVAPTGLTANITAKALTITGVTATDKVYDGTTTASVSGTPALLGTDAAGAGTGNDGKPYAGDAVTIAGTATGAFANKTIGSALPVTVSGLSLSGAQSSNYSLTAPAGLTANVTAKTLTVSGITAANRSYDGTTVAVLNTTAAALVGVVTGDVVTLSTSAAAGAFADANAGASKPVTISGVTIAGADAGNYLLTAPTITASITQATATISLSNLNQTYDGAAKQVTVTVTPAVATSTTYNGSANAPADAGSYAVAVTVTNPNYAGTSSGTLTIAPATQAVSFSLGSAGIGATISLSATASSGLPVTFSIVSGSATLSGSSLTITGPGSLTVRASQAGNGNYLPASTDATITGIKKLDQTITFGALSDKRATDAAFGVNASASSGLPVTITVVSGPALVAGNTVTLTGAPGPVSIRASQPGNDIYNAAPDITQTFTVAPVGPLIYFGKVGGSDMAAEVSSDSTSGTMIGILPGTGEGFVVNFDPSATGDWVATVTTFTGTTSTAASASADSAGSSEVRVMAIQDATPPVTAASASGTTRTFRGRVSGGILTGSIDDLNLTFTANLVPPTGPTAPIAGYYQSSSVKTATGSIYSIVGTTNQVYVLAITPDYVGGSSGTAASNGTFTVQAPEQTTITGSVDAPTTIVTGTLSRPSAPPENFAGLAVTTLRTDRLVNLSSRVGISSASQLITGFVISGTDPKTVLLRAVGPSLANFGVLNALPAARLRLFDSQGRLLREVSGWKDDATLPGTFGRVGAFALSAANTDSALVATLAPGAYTMQVISPPDSSGNVPAGVGLAEVYDASANPQGEYQRLVNISSRGTLTANDGALIGGFVVTGNSPKRLLIRGAGPALKPFGVGDALADPAITIYSGNTVLATNDNWETPVTVSVAQTAATPDQIVAAEQQVGAFSYSAGSLDSAVIVTLAPGTYTAVVSSTTGGTGTALIEVYEIPSN